MTWNETHERARIVREVEAAAAADPSGRLPWRPEYAAYFAGPQGLLTFLRARWDRLCQAQLEPGAPDHVFQEAIATLRAVHAGVLRILDQAAHAALAAQAAPAAQPPAVRAELEEV